MFQNKIIHSYVLLSRTENQIQIDLSGLVIEGMTTICSHGVSTFGVTWDDGFHLILVTTYKSNATLKISPPIFAPRFSFSDTLYGEPATWRLVAIDNMSAQRKSGTPSPRGVGRLSISEKGVGYRSPTVTMTTICTYMDFTLLASSLPLLEE